MASFFLLEIFTHLGLPSPSSQCRMRGSFNCASISSTSNSAARMFSSIPSSSRSSFHFNLRAFPSSFRTLFFFAGLTREAEAIASRLWHTFRVVIGIVPLLNRNLTRPPSKTITRSQIRSRNQRSWLTTTDVPEKLIKASSRTRRVCRSRSLVGSSRTRKVSARVSEFFARRTRFFFPAREIFRFDH